MLRGNRRLLLLFFLFLLAMVSLQATDDDPCNEKSRRGQYSRDVLLGGCRACGYRGLHF